ncbi:MAG TPA: MlaD family protein [Solirubrobacteraceae bacterium]|nr:MlaD family protein [Solirubrobacteraceae bacterium]
MSRRPNTFTGVVALAVIAVVVYFGWTKEIPFRSHYEVKAAFESSNNLRTGSPVRIAGVEVGKVTAVERGDGEGAIVTMRIKDEGRPVHADATAKIRPRIFLEGNFFVDMTAGSPSAPELKDGATIPVQQTATPVQLDEVLTALQSDTREDLKVLLREYGKGLDGAGARGFNRSIPYWEPAYRDSAIVADAMRGETGRDLSGYVKHAGATAAALDRNREQLKSLITDFNVAAGAFARQDGNLQAAIGELPRTLRAAMPALAELNESFPPLRALAVELRPGVQNSEATLDAATPWVRELRGLVSKPELRGLADDLGAAVPDLAALIQRSLPLYRQVRRAASCQTSVLEPWMQDTVPDEQFPAEGKVYEEAPKPLPGLSGESRSGDANGQWFRVLAGGGKNLVTFKPGVFGTTPEPILGANPPKPERRPPLNPDVPCETQQNPDLRTVPGKPPEQRTIDTSTAAFQARYAKARENAIEWLEGQLKAEGLSDSISVSRTPATQATIDKLRAGR